jgi:hypothetical protein
MGANVDVFRDNTSHSIQNLPLPLQIAVNKKMKTTTTNENNQIYTKSKYL